MNSSAGAGPFAGEIRRLRLRARGQVQGVGFRPHAYRTAVSLGLAGRVHNDGDGVIIEVEGLQVGEFEALFRATLPPLARVDSLLVEEQAVTGERRFVIEQSVASTGDVTVPADVAICEHCLDELFDADNRRYLHPFIACCDCGPRYTMTRRLPYDRSNTSMAAFPMCCGCSREYRDPESRRLHAEPIGCHDCGPTLSNPVEQIIATLTAGKIVALKGIGGYHLVCDARDSAAVKRLRARKRRDGRPFAVMMLNAQSAGTQVCLDENALEVIASPQRPVLIAERGAGFNLCDELAPGLSTLGVMLPYTAVHYLLFHGLAGKPEGHDWLNAGCDLALVMTSANLSGEPMLVDDGEAREKLSDIADLIVSHTRHITHGCDDSVVRASAQQTVMVRRGRGYAPQAVDLGFDAPNVLALGAHLKNTVCATRGQHAHLSAHIGDLDTAAVRALLDRSAAELQEWLRVEPEVVACDRHPDYASTQLAQHIAEELQIPLLPVQHHHAHIAAVAAAHQHREPVLGLALDGHGMGDDGGSWGGELLLVDGAVSERLAHLRPLALPGGDRAAREPWRLAVAALAATERAAKLPEELREKPLFGAVEALVKGTECPHTTACGRYFDAAAALLGLCYDASYEAEAPMRLESHCRELIQDAGLYAVEAGQLDLHPLLNRLVDIDDPVHGAGLFHGTLIEALTAWVGELAERNNLQTVALSGGCFLNGVLASQLPGRLRERGLTVLCDWTSLTPGDGSISLGQAWVAARHRRELTQAQGAPLTTSTTIAGGSH